MADLYRVETVWGPGRTWYIDRLDEGKDRDLTVDQAHARADEYRERGYQARLVLEGTIGPVDEEARSNERRQMAEIGKALRGAELAVAMQWGRARI